MSKINKMTHGPIFQTSFDALEREIRAEFQNLHRFLDEEECRDLERLRKERQKQLKQLKERERKIAGQGKDLEKAIGVLNNKLCEEDSPQLLKVSKFLDGGNVSILWGGGGKLFGLHP